MGFPVYSRAWRAGIAACGLLWFGAADLRAEPLEPSEPVASSLQSAEPFGLAASALPGGGLRDKWIAVQRRLDDEMVQLALCEGDRDNCASAAASSSARNAAFSSASSRAARASSVMNTDAAARNV